jgi:hypothetical protein
VANDNTRALDRAADDIEAIVADALTLAAARTVEAVVAEWPVDSGDSLAAWASDGPVVTNSTRYAEHVRDGLAWRLLDEAAANQAPDIERATTSPLTSILEAS